MTSSQDVAQKKSCFVIMPFGEPFDQYYREIFRPAITEAGLEPVRADEINKPGVIVDQIWRGISQAVLCVADVTGRNANVMYELGLAHAASKPVVQIVQIVADLPFDLRSFRHIVYDTKGPRWADTLTRQLVEMLQETLSDPDSTVIFPKSGLSDTSAATPAKEARESALLIALGPDQATREMKRILVRAYQSCPELDRKSAIDQIQTIIAEEVDRVQREALDESTPEDERDFARNMGRVVASRIDSMQTEFLVLAMENAKKPVVECLADAIKTWSPGWSNGDEVEDEDDE